MENSLTDLTRRGFLGLALTMGFTGALALVGCTGQQAAAPASSSASSSASTSAAQAVPASSAASANVGAGSSNILVAYYSASGNTRAVAEEIAATLEADLFAIEPVNAYTDDDLNWREDGSRVNVEHENDAERYNELVQTTPDRFAEYDTILLGYPIWWGIAAWPVDGFVSGNDFTGKTIIPFCTSTSSGLGDSAKELETLAGTGQWEPGQRFAGNVPPEDVKEWALGLGI